jgi:hypothetical protein
MYTMNHHQQNSSNKHTLFMNLKQDAYLNLLFIFKLTLADTDNCRNKLYVNCAKITQQENIAKLKMLIFV